MTPETAKTASEILKEISLLKDDLSKLYDTGYKSGFCVKFKPTFGFFISQNYWNELHFNTYVSIKDEFENRLKEAIKLKIEEWEKKLLDLKC